eukprot:scaffold18498_cov89-Isochrysis_galbana.AAC.1
MVPLCSMLEPAPPRHNSLSLLCHSDRPPPPFCPQHSHCASLLHLAAGAHFAFARTSLRLLGRRRRLGPLLPAHSCRIARSLLPALPRLVCPLTSPLCPVTTSSLFPPHFAFLTCAPMSSSKSANRFSRLSFCAITFAYSRLRFSACRRIPSALASALRPSSRTRPTVSRSRMHSACISATEVPSPSPAAAAAARGELSASAAACLARDSIASASSLPPSLQSFSLCPPPRAPPLWPPGSAPAGLPAVAAFLSWSISES